MGMLFPLDNWFERIVLILIAVVLAFIFAALTWPEYFKKLLRKDPNEPWFRKKT